MRNPFYNITWNPAELQNTPGFNTMHPWSKEMHLLQRIPNLHWLQWNLSSFTNSKIWHTLGRFKISRERFDIFEKGFLRPVSNSHDQIQPCRGHLTSTLGHRGSQWIHGAFLLRLSVLYNSVYSITIQVLLNFKWIGWYWAGAWPLVSIYDLQ